MTAAAASKCSRTRVYTLMVLAFVVLPLPLGLLVITQLKARL